MPPRHVVLALVLVVVASSIGVGAAASSVPGGGSSGASGSAGNVAASTASTTANNTSAPPLGESLSLFMQSNAAQTAGTVENGMWEAAFANASNASEKRALVERRVGELNATLAELEAERRALRAAFRNGSINRSTYRARLSAIVGRLAALGQGIDSAGDRGETVGVNRTRLDVLRTQARNLSGAEISRLARNLTGDRGPPGAGDVFEDDRRGPPADRGPANASNRSDDAEGPEDPGNVSRGESERDNRTGKGGNATRGDGAGQSGNTTRGGGNGQGQSGDGGDGSDGQGQSGDGGDGGSDGGDKSGQSGSGGSGGNDQSSDGGNDSGQGPPSGNDGGGSDDESTPTETETA